MPSHSPRSTRRLLVPGFLMLAVLATIMTYAASRPPAARATEHDHAEHASHDMSEAAMQAMVDEFYESHPRVPAQPAAVLGSFVEEYLAVGTTFSADGDFIGTLVDTVVIGVGETVQWRRLIGVHTVTSGTDAADPQAGLLFDVPLDAATPIFQYTYNVEGTFPFFCRPHEEFNMTGVVIVIGPTPNQSTTWGEVKARSRQLTPGR